MIWFLFLLNSFMKFLFWECNQSHTVECLCKIFCFKSFWAPLNKILYNSIRFESIREVNFELVFVGFVCFLFFFFFYLTDCVLDNREECKWKTKKTYTHRILLHNIKEKIIFTHLNKLIVHLICSIYIY